MNPAVLARLLAFVAWNVLSIIRLQGAVHFAFLAVLLDDPVIGVLQTWIIGKSCLMAIHR